VNVRLERVDPSKRVVFDRLLQLHLYEIGMNPSPDGLIEWGEPLDKFFSDPTCVPLFITAEGHMAGFALIKLDRKPPGPDGKTPMNANLIEEFHVLRPYSRKGIGTRAADLIFRQQPGRWMVTSRPDRVRVAFWRHVAMERPDVNGVEFTPDDHKGYPGQHVWIIEPTEGKGKPAHAADCR